jgi:hypothetical protein
MDVCDRHEIIAMPAADKPATPEPAPAASTLDEKLLNKYGAKGKHSTISPDKNPAADQSDKAKALAHVTKSIIELKKTPVFFAKGGARAQGEILKKINDLKKSPTTS